MTESTIKDGRTGKTATVDNGNRLLTKAVTQSDATNASLNGDTFAVPGDIVNLTTDTISWLAYIKNTDTVSWIVTVLEGSFGGSDGTGEFSTTIASNPTGGTLISAGSAVTPINLNLGDSKTLTGVFLAGAQGSTLSGSVVESEGLVPAAPSAGGGGTGPIVIPPGASFAAGLTPPTGNTSMNVQLSAVLFRMEEL